MIKKFVICTLLFVCIAAFEVYDENRIFGMYPEGDENYGEENYDYQDLGPIRPLIHNDPAQSLMLYQLFNSLQNRDDARLHMPYRPKFSMMDNPPAGYGHVPFSELMDFKGAVAKRRLAAPAALTAQLSSGTNSGLKGKPSNPEQDTNPIVKPLRKKLPTWICYLKLCSVRFPVRPTSSSG